MKTPMLASVSSSRPKRVQSTPTDRIADSPFARRTIEGHAGIIHDAGFNAHDNGAALDVNQRAINRITKSAGVGAIPVAVVGECRGIAAGGIHDRRPAQRSLRSRVVAGSVMWILGLLMMEFFIGSFIVYRHPHWIPYVHSSFLWVSAAIFIIAGFLQMRMGLSPLSRLHATLTGDYLFDPDGPIGMITIDIVASATGKIVKTVNGFAANGPFRPRGQEGTKSASHNFVVVHDQYVARC